MQTTVREVEIVSESKVEEKTPMPSITSLMKETFLWYKKNFKTIFNIFFIPTVLMIPISFFDLINGSGESFFGSKGIILGIILVIVSVIQVVLNIVVTIGFVRKVPTFKTITPHWIDVYKTGFAFFWAVVLVGLIQFMTVFPGFVFFVIPGIILSFYFVFSIYSVMIDEKKGINALVHSFYLVRSNLFRVATRLIGLGIFVLFSIFISFFLIESITFFLPGFLPEIIMASADSFIQLTVLTPIIIIYNNLIYESLSKNVKEIGREEELKYKKRIKVMMILTGAIFVGMFIMAVIIK